MSQSTDVMEKIVALCRRRGFIFGSSEIYGGIGGFWDYGPLGCELKKNIKDVWWEDMVRNPPPGPDGREYQMVGVDCSIIMNPKVWEASGHVGGFADLMQACRQCKKLFRADQLLDMLLNAEWVISLDAHNRKVNPNYLPGAFAIQKMQLRTWASKVGKKLAPNLAVVRDTDNVLALAERLFSGEETELRMPEFLSFLANGEFQTSKNAFPCPNCGGDLTEPRQFNLMFKTIVGAVESDDNLAYLRPETAQGIFANFKNVMDSTRVKIPFGIAQVGKAFRNEINPRNFTFRSREFEQMEIEFFCNPKESRMWYEFWRDVRKGWYTQLGIKSDKLRPREQGKEELAHYSCGTTDIEYLFPFSDEPQELEGVAHRGDFDLKAHGKHARGDEMAFAVVDDSEPRSSDRADSPDSTTSQNSETPRGPKSAARDDANGPRGPKSAARFVPHVIEPSAGADRFTLAVICEAYSYDESRASPEFMKFHPRLAPIKAAVFPLVAKDGMPEIAEPIFRDIKKHFPAQYDAKQSIGKRYARMDEAGTPYCFTIDGQSKEDGTVTVRNRDDASQIRIDKSRCLEYLRDQLRL